MVLRPLHRSSRPPRLALRAAARCRARRRGAGLRDPRGVSIRWSTKASPTPTGCVRPASPVELELVRGVTHDFIKMGRALARCAGGATGRRRGAEAGLVRSMKRTDFRYLDRQRVRWAEIDAQKIVFNAHYLMYFDTAVAGYWRALALPYAEIDGASRRRPLRAQGDARVSRLGALRRRARHRHPLRAHRQLVAAVLGRGVPRRGTARSAASWSTCSPIRRRRPRSPVPQELRDVLKPSRPASRWSMCASATGSRWVAMRRRIRSEVFVDEQRIPAEMEWDAADAGLRRMPWRSTASALPLATGRLLEHVPGVAKIGRMAVARTMRGSARRPRGARRADARGARARLPRGCACTRSCRRRRSTARAGFAAARAGVRRSRHPARGDGARSALDRAAPARARGRPVASARPSIVTPRCSTGGRRSVVAQQRLPLATNVRSKTCVTCRLARAR